MNKIENPYDLIVIGASSGGLNALQTIFDKLTRSFPIPIAVVIHRQQSESSELVSLLQKHTKQIVVEPEDKMKIEKGYIYVAPTRYHLLVNDDCFSLSVDEPVRYARPSIDVLFDAAAFSKKEKLIGILLTGSGNDGIRGLQQVQLHGGHTIVQDPKTAECDVLPKGAIERMTPDQVLSIEDMAPALNLLCAVRSQ